MPASQQQRGQALPGRTSNHTDLGSIRSAGPNPAISDLIVLPEGSPSPCRIARPPQAVHVRAKKHTPIYRAHSYHTKVPPQGIEPFVRHFTRSNGLVLDPFCGSGMTGVAALRAGRRAILCDLSPAATFIAANCCTSVDAEAFLAEAGRIAAAVKGRLGGLYLTPCPTCRDKANVTMTVFSARYRCPHCRRIYALWDVARAGRQTSRKYACPGCAYELRKSHEHLVDWKPALVKYACKRCGTGEKSPSSTDLKNAKELDAAALPKGLWCPADPIPVDSDEISRVLRSGIKTVSDLFTGRNRLALASLWKEIGGVRDEALRSRLAFAFTGTLPRASRTNKYIPSLHAAPGPLLGTMYIPGFYPEINVFDLFGRKVKDVANAMDAMPPLQTAPLRVSTQSASDLSNIPDGCIDYVFTDPPFGSNIQYSELNLMWESWLGERTNAASEAVINRSQGKSHDDYSGLMAQAFGEMRRVLRPGGWMTLLFHNTSGRVWQCIQRALEAAQFDIKSIGTFDKAHDTFKQVTAEGAVGYDVIVHSRKSPAGRAKTQAARKSPAAHANRLEAFLEERLRGVTGAPKSAQLRKLHAEAVGHFISNGQPVDFDYDGFRAEVERHLPQGKKS